MSDISGAWNAAHAVQSQTDAAIATLRAQLAAITAERNAALALVREFYDQFSRLDEHEFVRLEMKHDLMQRARTALTKEG